MNRTGNGHKFERKLVEGVGINDYPTPIKSGTKEKKAYIIWHNMFFRCYSQTNLRSHPSYKGCVVCEEWKRFSIFKKWFDENYVEDYSLDKDIISKNNKVYSSDTCCFVPREINMILCNRKKSRGKFPVGVCKFRNKFAACVNELGKNIFWKVFDTYIEAFYAYKTEKELSIKRVAQKYYDENKITKRVYDALMKYEVEITD